MQFPPHEAADTWILQEKFVYTFQQSQGPCRRPEQQTLCQSVSQSNDAPDIVLLSLWPQASHQQVQRYISGYNELYPDAKVVLLQGSSTLTSRADVEAYYNTLNELIDAQFSTTIPTSRLTLNGDLQARRPSVLLHMFGTSGAAGACRMLRGFRLRADAPLNVGAVIADTEPSASLTTFLTSYQPISSAFFSLVLAFWIRLQEYMLFWPLEPHTAQVHEDLNNPDLLPANARKCFIFAQRGLMLTWMKNSISHHVTKSGVSACASGYGTSTGLEMWNDEQDERREYTFRRSSIDRKGRWSGDQEQYWSGIEGAWGPA